MKIGPARETAFHILLELANSTQAHSDDLLQGPSVEKLSQADRNLCTALVMGVLRWQPALDARIAKLLTHKSKLDEPVRIALRLGAFQLLFMDRIPAHAAISDSVELSKRAGHRFASGLVNAVLRKIATLRQTIGEPGTPSSTRSDAVGVEMCAEDAHPAWLLERWNWTYGAVATSAICTYDQQQPAVVVRIAQATIEEELRREGIQLEPASFLTAARRVLSTSLAQNQDRQARMQDEGSQLVAELLGGTNSKVRSILDCCAAPGGKTAILAERNPQASIVAWDVSSARLEKLRERFSTSPTLARIECRVRDAASMPSGESYDLILCDVPCSGTGTLARNPEIKLRLQPADLLRQQERQVAILRGALAHLAPGGRLLYSTCSLEPEENEQVIDLVLGELGDVKSIPIEERIRELIDDGVLHRRGAEHLLEHAVSGDFLRTIPGVSPCDGFFAALLGRGVSL